MRKNKIIKGYKMFDADWRCRGFQYEVGKTYEIEGEIIPCEHGFHFCKKIEDCFNYYDCVTWNHIAEVEALGEVKEKGDKYVTNKIKIVKEIKWDELKGIGVNDSHGVSLSYSVSKSCGVNFSGGVNFSHGVNYSHGVDCSNGVNFSDGVSLSCGVSKSYGVNFSDGVNDSHGVNLSDGVNYSHGVNRSNGVDSSDGVNYSYGVANSFGVYCSYGVNNGLFVANKPETYILFNKEVTEERYWEVKSKLLRVLNGWSPTFNNLQNLYLKHGGEWRLTPVRKAQETIKEEAWADMPKEAIEYLKSLPEFDAEIFEEITGIEVK